LPTPWAKWTSGTLREARALVWKRRYAFLLGVALLLVNRAAGLVLPASSRYLIDHVVGERRAALLAPIAFAIGFAAIVQAVTTFWLSTSLTVAAQRSIAELRRRIEAHVMRLPIRYFDSTRSGVILSKVMADTELVRDLIGSGLVHFGGSTITALFALAYLLFLNAPLTIVLLAVVTAFGAAIAWSFGHLRRLQDENAEIRAGILARLSESVAGIRVVKTYTAEKREDRIFTAGVYRLFRNLATSQTWWSANTALTALAIGLLGVLVAFFGGHAILSGAMTVGEFLTYVLFLALMVGPIEHVVSMAPHVGEALSALDRIHDVLKEPTERDDESRRTPIGLIAGEVRFEDVSFEYEPGVPALRQVSLVAPAGTTVALVGASGSGKSTLIGLVLAFARPTTGRILIDGRDLATVRLDDYRSQLGVVLQDSFLFDGTIAENIRYGCANASNERVRRASEVAHADEFIRRLPRQYATEIGERGVRLSGGQRQRVAIARAILVNPRILVLDEATSSLDSESEAFIQDGLRSLRQGRTTFVIAHRLSTVRTADVILVLDRGRIVARGTHAQLLERSDLYRMFYERQHAMDVERFVNPGEEIVSET